MLPLPPRTRVVLLLVALGALLTRGSNTPAQSLAAVSNGEVIAIGFDGPMAVAVGPSGAIVVSDSKAGTVTELTPGGRRILAAQLGAPAGLAFEPDGALLIVEQEVGRVLRRDPSGAVSVLASDLVRPTWIAVGAESAYVSTKCQRPARTDGEDNGADCILQVLRSGTVRTFAVGLRGLEGLAVSGGALYAALRRLATDRGREGAQIVRYALRPDGSAGSTDVLLSGSSQGPMALAVDRLGALFASTRLEAGRGSERGAVMKQLAGGMVVTLASGLRNPRGIAFEPDGHLLVVEGEPARQLRRFRAPSPPSIVVPPFTNQSPLALKGHSVGGALVQAFRDGQLTTALAATATDVATGAFTVAVPLALNQETRLSFTATEGGGAGLTSAPASHAVLHDDHQPTLSILKPIAGIHTRGAVSLRARAEDDGSGVARIAAYWDDRQATTVDNADPVLPLDVDTTLDTASLVEGARTLSVTATDRAGNAASAAQLVTIDRTAPETRIASGPGGEIAETAATFVVEGADLLSPTLEFAWRLDSGAWSPFGLATTVPLTALTPGDHRFEAIARDLAGNEDPSPAVQTFTVRSLRIRITEPADGSVVTTSSVWLRGTVEGGVDVTVTVSLPPGLPIASLPASTESGTFAVEVPVDAATTTVTATAADATSGATATATITVLVQPDASASTFGLTAVPAAGLAPHVASFSVNVGEGVQVTLDQDSNGTTDFEGTTLDGLSFVYDRPGIYVATLRVTSAQGEVTTYRAPVEVYDAVALDARLQAVWSGFAAALQNGDVARAVSFIHGNRRGAWQEYFGQLPPGELTAEATGLTAIEPVSVGRGGAEYEMLREEDGRIFSYPVVFVADSDGRWRLWQF